MKDKPLVSVDVVIPTYRPGQEVQTLIERLLQQTHPVRRIIIMNTEEHEWIASPFAQAIGRLSQVEVHHVTKAEFDHGKTRDLGIHYAQAEVVICMTQDALPAKRCLVEHLVKGLEQEAVAMAYACQLPKADCDILERYTRSFNYPQQDQVKSKQDLERLGIKTYFASNVCAAYQREIYLALGGFTKKTIFNEDMIFAAIAMEHGYKVAYCSQAQVIHSHNYNGLEQLRRNFDLAVSQADHPEIFGSIVSEREGLRLVKQTARYLIKNKKMYLLPKLIMMSGFKLIGYQLGKRYVKLPKYMIRCCTMNADYWV